MNFDNRYHVDMYVLSMTLDDGISIEYMEPVIAIYKVVCITTSYFPFKFVNLNVVHVQESRKCAPQFISSSIIILSRPIPSASDHPHSTVHK